MRLRIKSGSLGSALGLLGTGLPIMWPNAKWLGLAFILAGVAIFFFDVHFEQGHVAVGGGQRSFPARLHSGVRRLATNWLPLAMICAAVALSGLAWQRITASESASVQRKVLANNLPPPLTSNRPAPHTQPLPTPRPVPKPRGTPPSLSDHMPQKPPVAPPKETPVVEPQPNLPVPEQSPKPAALVPDPAAVEAARIAAETRLTAQVSIVRKHREEGDIIFKELFDANTDVKIVSAVNKEIAWDREGADLMVDFFGSSARAAYFVGPNYVEPYYIIGSDFTSVTEYLDRRLYLNRIRSRQAAMGDVVSQAREASRAAGPPRPSPTSTGPEKKQ